MSRNKELKVHSLQPKGRSLCSIRSNRKWCKRRGSSMQCQNCFFVYTISDCNLKNLLLRQTESFKRYRLPTNISASIVKVFSFLKSISVLSTWKSSGVMSAKILISSNGISYDSETLFW